MTHGDERPRPHRATAAAPAVTPDAGPVLLRPLRIRDFRLLFAGETVSVLGDQFHFGLSPGSHCS